MPQSFNPTGQDWDPVTTGPTRKPTIPKTNAAISSMKRAGLMTTEKRHGAGGNSSAHSATVMSAKKLEESEDLQHSTVPKTLSKAIQQARMAKKMTQKELATAINEKPQVIAEYENGKAIPNGQIIVKIERKLGCKLPRPGKKPSGGGDGGAKKTTIGGIGLKSAAAKGLTRGGPPKRR
jgi:putative transcription factor